MARESIFADEWRECLRAHYMHVIRENDQNTLKSLTSVLQSAGFDETELRELEVLATMHVDEVADDFVPDLDILQSDEGFIEVETDDEPVDHDDPTDPKQLSMF